MSYGHPSEIMDEIASLAPMFAGVKFDRLDDGGLSGPYRPLTIREQRPCMRRASAAAWEGSMPYSTSTPLSRPIRNIP